MWIFSVHNFKYIILLCLLRSKANICIVVESGQKRLDDWYSQQKVHTESQADTESSENKENIPSGTEQIHPEDYKTVEVQAHSIVLRKLCLLIR